MLCSARKRHVPRGQPCQAADVVCGYCGRSDDLVTHEAICPAGLSHDPSRNIRNCNWPHVAFSRKAAAHDFFYLFIF